MLQLICIRKSLNKKPSSFICLKFIQKCKIKDLGASASSPTRQPFSKLTTSQMAFSRGFILKNGDFIPPFFHNSYEHYQHHYQSIMRKQCFLSKQFTHMPNTILFHIFTDRFLFCVETTESNGPLVKYQSFSAQFEMICSK